MENSNSPNSLETSYKPEGQNGGRRRRRFRNKNKTNSNMFFKNFLSKKMRSSKRSRRMTRRR